MHYFVYENWPTRRARGHEAACSYCQHGQGMHAADSGRNGRWSGFATREEAERKLAQLRAKGWRDVGWCARCG